jgi:hypothetical protein
MSNPIVFTGLTLDQANATAQYHGSLGATVKVVGDGTGLFNVEVTYPSTGTGADGSGTQGRGAAGGEGDGASILPKAVQVALNEMNTFARKNGAVVLEKQPPLASRVLDYFKLVGRPDITDPSAEPWSAAFISFVMKTAGAAPTDFPISQNHARYILAGLANRMRNRMNAPIVYFDRNEMAPKVGDLVGLSRTAQVRNRADLERLLPDTFFPSHTDLVVALSPGRIQTIGGNLSDSIRTTNIRTDSQGRIDPSDQHFFVLQLNI